MENGKWKMENARFLELSDSRSQPPKSQVSRGHFFHRISFDDISGLHVLEPL